MGSFPNGLPLGMFGWSKYKILPVYGEKRPIYVYSYLDTKIYIYQCIGLNEIIEMF